MVHTPWFFSEINISPIINPLKETKQPLSQAEPESLALFLLSFMGWIQGCDTEVMVGWQLVLVGLRKPEAILSQGDWAGFLCVRIDSHHLSLWEKVAQLWKETQSWFSLRGTLEWKVLTLGWNRWFASRECGRLMFLRF